MKEILLTQHKVALVDDDDYEWLVKFHWHARKERNSFYALTAMPDGSGPCKYTKMGMHRLIMLSPYYLNVDHIDGDGLNNQKSNLRVVTPLENSLRRKIPVNNTHDCITYPGVYATLGAHTKWCARIRVNHKLQYIGIFDRIEDASAAYRVAHRFLRGCDVIV